MSNRAFSLIAGIVFLLIALGHILRLLFAVTFVVQGVPVPMWVSGLALVVMAFLAYEGLRLAKKPHTGQ